MAMKSKGLLDRDLVAYGITPQSQITGRWSYGITPQSQLTGRWSYGITPQSQITGRWSERSEGTTKTPSKRTLPFAYA